MEILNVPLDVSHKRIAQKALVFTRRFHFMVGLDVRMQIGPAEEGLTAETTLPLPRVSLVHMLIQVFWIGEDSATTLAHELSVVVVNVVTQGLIVKVFRLIHFGVRTLVEKVFLEFIFRKALHRSAGRSVRLFTSLLHQ